MKTTILYVVWASFGLQNTKTVLEVQEHSSIVT